MRTIDAKRRTRPTSSSFSIARKKDDVDDGLKPKRKMFIRDETRIESQTHLL